MEWISSDKEKLEKAIKYGPVKYVLVVGLTWAIFFCILYTLMLGLLENSSFFTIEKIITNLIISLVGGFLFGTVLWIMNDLLPRPKGRGILGSGMM